MTSTHAWSKPPEVYCERLQEFERQFDYPLTDTRRFRIEHSREYERFFAAMGDSLTVVVENAGKILGVLSGAIRTLNITKGKSEKWLYIGDAKIEESARGRHVLKQLFKATQSWVGIKCTKAYSVVMDGTGITPAMYTGRLGIPKFQPVQSVKLLAFSTSSLLRHSVDTTNVERNGDPRAFTDSRQATQFPRPAPHWSNEKTSIRSRMSPAWFTDTSTKCIGLLEDTRGAKRLWDTNDGELLYAHLSNTRYESLEDIIPIIVEAGKLAYTRGCKDLLLAVPAREWTTLKEFLSTTQHDIFSSTVYSTARTVGYELPISSSEI